MIPGYIVGGMLDESRHPIWLQPDPEAHWSSTFLCCAPCKSIEKDMLR